MAGTNAIFPSLGRVFRAQVVSDLGFALQGVAL